MEGLYVKAIGIGGPVQPCASFVSCEQERVSKISLRDKSYSSLLSKVF